MRCKLTSLEYNVVWTCNNSCASCSHMSPVNPARFVLPREFEESLGLAAGVIEVDEFSLLGGEPLLHPNLLELVRIAKESGISERVQITTNGKLLDKQPEEFWRTIQALRVTRYPGQVSDEQWSRWKHRCDINGVYFHGGMQAEFYKPISRYVREVEDAQAVFDRCRWKSHCTTLEGSNLYLCPQALFFPVHFPQYADSGCPLVLSKETTPQDVAEFMTRRRRLDVCKLCSYSVYSPWKQVARDAWFEESTDA